MQFFRKFWQNRMLVPLPPPKELVPPPRGNVMGPPGALLFDVKPEIALK